MGFACSQQAPQFCSICSMSSSPSREQGLPRTALLRQAGPSSRAVPSGSSQPSSSLQTGGSGTGVPAGVLPPGAERKVVQARGPPMSAPTPRLLRLLKVWQFWAILARSSEGRGSSTSSGRLRFTPTFRSLRTQGWDRLRASPLGRRASSGVDAGVLLAEGGPSPEKEKRSWEQDRERGRSSRAPPVRLQGWGRDGARGPGQGEQASGRDGRLKLELRCMGAPEKRCTLPPL